MKKLIIMLLASAITVQMFSCVVLADLEESTDLEYHFNVPEDAEIFRGNASCITDVKGGALVITQLAAGDTDPNVPNIAMPLNPTYHKFASIRVKNPMTNIEAPAAKLALYIFGDTLKVYTFSIAPSSGFVVYNMPLTDIPTNITSVRLDPFDGVATTVPNATIYIDYMKFTKTPQDTIWDFTNGSLDGWFGITPNITQQTSANGVATFEISGGGATYIANPIRFRTTDYKYATIRMKNNTASADMHFYLPYGAASYGVFTPTPNDTKFRNYTVAISNTTLQEDLRIGLNATSGTIEIDKITLSNIAPIVEWDMTGNSSAGWENRGGSITTGNDYATFVKGTENNPNKLFNYPSADYKNILAKMNIAYDNQAIFTSSNGIGMNYILNTYTGTATATPTERILAFHKLDSNLTRLELALNEAGQQVYIENVRLMPYAVIKDLKIQGNSIPDFYPTKYEYILKLPATKINSILDSDITFENFITNNAVVSTVIANSRRTKRISVYATEEGVTRKYTIHLLPEYDLYYVGNDAKNIKVINNTNAELTNPVVLLATYKDGVLFSVKQADNTTVAANSEINLSLQADIISTGVRTTRAFVLDSFDTIKPITYTYEGN